jgi:hypothetical protein
MTAYTGTVADLAPGNANIILDPEPAGGTAMETLHCTSCDNDFTRERKRGVKPRVCPACKTHNAPTPARTATIVVAADPEFVALYMGGDWRIRDRRIAEAFVRAGIEPPTQSKIDMVGFNAAQRKILNGSASEDNVEDFEPVLAAA